MRRRKLIIMSLLHFLAVVAFGSSLPPILPTYSDLFPLPIVPGENSTSTSDLPLPAKVIDNTPKQDSILLAAPDGNIYQVNIISGKILRSFPTGSPTYDAHQSPNLEQHIDSGDDWQLYIHDKSSKPEGYMSESAI